ncbi:hypothetical protein OAD26_00425 [bacterium]|nr:hypothetical protein [bacterium]
MTISVKKLFVLAIVTTALIVGGCATTTVRSPGPNSKAKAYFGQLVICPCVDISIINGTRSLIEVEGEGMHPKTLAPGEMAKISLRGGYSSARSELMYIAFALGPQKIRTGAVQFKKFRMPKKNNKSYIWVVERMREPR